MGGQGDQAVMSRVLIAGCGYVGTVLGAQLARQGHEVFGLRRDPNGLPGAIQPVAADLTCRSSLGSLPHNVQTLFYMAGAGAHTPGAYHAAYVDGPANLLEVLRERQQPVGRFFFVSSTGVYRQEDGQWVDESSPTSAVHFAGRCLLAGEQRVLEGPFPATVVRFSGIYGPGRCRIIDAVRAGEARRYPGRRYLNHIHRDDAAGVLAHLMGRTGLADRYLATDDEPVERSEALDWVAHRLDLPRPPLDRNTAEAGGRGVNRRYRNRRLRETGFSFQFPTYREGYGDLITRRGCHSRKNEGNRARPQRPVE